MKYKKNTLVSIILVGLTYLNKDESFREQIQIHGPIKEVTEHTIVFTRKDNDEEFSIPFDENNLSPSDPELIYNLRSTNEAVEGVNNTYYRIINMSEEE
jgi:hypothetical protein